MRVTSRLGKGRAPRVERGTIGFCIVIPGTESRIRLRPGWGLCFRHTGGGGHETVQSICMCNNGWAAPTGNNISYQHRGRSCGIVLAMCHIPALSDIGILITSHFQDFFRRCPRWNPRVNAVRVPRETNILPPPLHRRRDHEELYDFSTRDIS